MDNIVKKGIELAKGIAFDMRTECDGSYVGESSSFEFEIDNNKYKVNIDVFWESSSHFDISITGDNYKNRKIAVFF